jgi:signal transduction histidine kinase
MLRGAQLSGHAVAYSESGLSVFAKPLALKRAIGNLLDNALFYGTRAEIIVSADNHFLDIQIRDFGPGVPQEALANLTQSYVRLEHGRAQNAGGLGLGLSIVNTIALAHGGSLILKNHPDGGLIAIIRLPLDRG